MKDVAREYSASHRRKAVKAFRDDLDTEKLLSGRSNDIITIVREPTGAPTPEQEGSPLMVEEEHKQTMKESDEEQVPALQTQSQPLIRSRAPGYRPPVVVVENDETSQELLSQDTKPPKHNNILTTDVGSPLMVEEEHESPFVANSEATEEKMDIEIIQGAQKQGISLIFT